MMTLYEVFHLLQRKGYSRVFIKTCPWMRLSDLMDMNKWFLPVLYSIDNRRLASALVGDGDWILEKYLPGPHSLSLRGVPTGTHEINENDAINITAFALHPYHA